MAITQLSLTDFTNKTKYPNIPANEDAMRAQMSGPSNDIRDYINSTLIPSIAPLDSPVLTGTPTAPTPPAGDNSYKIANTAFIANILSQSTDGKFILPNGLKIQWATDDILANYDNANICEAGVTFGSPYTQPPIVIPLITQATNMPAELSWVPRYFNVTTTTCTIYVYDSGSHFNGGLRPWIRWIAIGY